MDCGGLWWAVAKVDLSQNLESQNQVIGGPILVLYSDELFVTKLQ
jgi:hypothetical protein